jgi:CBS domain-containing protein
MELVRSLMTEQPRTVGSRDTMAQLERVLTENKIGGAPVVDGDQLVGVVSRADVVRHLAVEQARAEYASDWYRDRGLVMDDSQVDEIGALAGECFAHLHVGDVMSTKLLTVSPEAPASTAAAIMLEHGVHRLLVTNDGELLGVLATTDLLRLLARAETPDLVD